MTTGRKSTNLGCKTILEYRLISQKNGWEIYYGKGEVKVAWNRVKPILLESPKCYSMEKDAWWNDYVKKDMDEKNACKLKKMWMIGIVGALYENCCRK